MRSGKPIKVYLVTWREPGGQQHHWCGNRRTAQRVAARAKRDCRARARAEWERYRRDRKAKPKAERDGIQMRPQDFYDWAGVNTVEVVPHHIPRMARVKDFALRLLNINPYHNPFSTEQRSEEERNDQAKQEEGTGPTKPTHG